MVLHLLPTNCDYTRPPSSLQSPPFITMSAAFIPKPLSEKKVLSNKACSRILLNIANATAQADWPRDIGTPGELELVFSRPPAVGDPVAGPSAIPYTVADSATLRKASNTGSKKRKLGVRDKENVAEEKPRKRYKEGFPVLCCGEQLADKGTYTRHLKSRTHRDKTREEHRTHLWVCAGCHMRYGRPDELRRHWDLPASAECRSRILEEHPECSGTEQIPTKTYRVPL